VTRARNPGIFLAFDLGAESGRAVVGTLADGRLAIEELHRFPTRLVRVNGHLHWDIWHLFAEIKRGLAIAAARNIKPDSIGIDTWGVDFALLARDGSVLGLPYSYRDPRTRGAMSAFFKLVPKRRIYELTGIQFLPINTLYQLFAVARTRSPLLDVAHDLLFMPDLFNFLLTGRKQTEFTIATTSQLYDTGKSEWSVELLEAVGVSPKPMQDVVKPGTVIGKVLPEVCEEAGVHPCPVVATASHDTAAAVAAVPARGNDWAYISSGTWSLVGVETDCPNTGQDAFKHNFTNEGGVGGTFRLLKNVTGLWLLRRCLEEWQKVSYASLLREAARLPFPKTFIDPDSPLFACPASMTRAIGDYCRKSRQSVPDTPASFTGVILASLALKYRLVLDDLRSFHRTPVSRVHVVGGGSKNKLLCQMTADALGLPVFAGPAEATAIGNIMVQAMALGQVPSLAEIREKVRDSFRPVEYRPHPSPAWDRTYARFREIME